MKYFEPNPLAGTDEPPTAKPHLGVLVNEDPPKVLGLPPGSIFYIIEDPKDVSKITPVVLIRADHKGFVFKCACMKPECTRWADFKGKWRGVHPKIHKET